MISKLRVLGMPSNNGAIGRLRIEEPCQALNDMGIADAKIFDPDKNPTQEQVVNAVRDADLVWFQGIMNQMYLWNILNLRRFNPKIKLLMDTDDNLYCVNPWNPSYQAFSQDDTVELGKTTLKMPKKRNHARLRMFETQLIEADAVAVTTNLLAAAYAHLNKNIYVMPNRLIWKNWHFPYIPKKDDGKVRVSWMGGSSHVIDLVEIHGATSRLLKKYPEMVMQFQTSIDCYADFLRDFGESRVELWGWIDYTGHPFRMNCLKPDIAVIPLHEDEFSVCKSDLKLAEYAAIGVPAVCSNISPYKDSVIHGETGFLAKDDFEFEKYIELLITNKELRLKMGQAAYEWAEKERCLETGIHKVKSMLDEVMAQPSWHIAPVIKKKELAVA